MYLKQYALPNLNFCVYGIQMQLEIALQTSEPTDRLKYMLSNMKNFENWKNKLLRRYISYILCFIQCIINKDVQAYFGGGGKKSQWGIQ